MNLQTAHRQTDKPQTDIHTTDRQTDHRQTADIARNTKYEILNPKKNTKIPKYQNTKILKNTKNTKHAKILKY
jgi:hypothetical protein